MIKKCLTTIIVILSILMCIPAVESSIGKPDLIIKNIIVEGYGHHAPPYQQLCCRVKNIGDAPVDETIYVTIIVYGIFIFPIRRIEIFEGFEKLVGELSRGETIDIIFAYERDFPILGFFLFNGKVNPDRTIDESNFLNNCDIDHALRLGISWFDL